MILAFSYRIRPAARIYSFRLSCARELSKSWNDRVKQLRRLPPNSNRCFVEISKECTSIGMALTTTSQARYVDLHRPCVMCWSPRSFEDLWEKALNNLSAADKALLHTCTNRLEVLEEVLLMVRGAEQTCQQKRWKWKNRRGEFVIVRDIFTKMVVWIDKLKGIGDNIAQFDPSHAALPWAAARLVLQVSCFTLNDTLLYWFPDLHLFLGFDQWHWY